MILFTIYKKNIGQTAVACEINIDKPLKDLDSALSCNRKHSQTSLSFGLIIFFFKMLFVSVPESSSGAIRGYLKTHSGEAEMQSSSHCYCLPGFCEISLWFSLKSCHHVGWVKVMLYFFAQRANTCFSVIKRWWFPFRLLSFWMYVTHSSDPLGL